MTSVLIVVSAANHWTLNDGHRTSHRLLGRRARPSLIGSSPAAGWDITIATPGGSGRPPSIASA